MSAYTTTDEQGYTSWWCPMCGGSSHPATGCAYSPGFVVCWRCTREAAKWLQHWTARPKRKGKGGPSFYDHNAKKSA